MAIRASIKKTESGFSGELVATDVYIKVCSISGNKDLLTFHATGSVNDDQIFSGSYAFTPSLSGDNFIKQAYDHMKSLPEFSCAMDC